MLVEILWPSGATAEFDGETWTVSADAPVTPEVLALVPRDVSGTIDGWEYWHALDVATQFGAEVMDPPPSSENTPDDVVLGQPGERPESELAASSDEPWLLR